MGGAPTSAHVSGEAVDIGRSDAAAWLSEHSAKYSCCRICSNESWHYEPAPEAIDHGCPPITPTLRGPRDAAVTTCARQGPMSTQSRGAGRNLVGTLRRCLPFRPEGDISRTLAASERPRPSAQRPVDGGGDDFQARPEALATGHRRRGGRCGRAGTFP